MYMNKVKTLNLYITKDIKNYVKQQAHMACNGRFLKFLKFCFKENSQLYHFLQNWKKCFLIF